MYRTRVCCRASITKIEDNRELTEKVWRDLWQFTVKPRADEVVLMTFKVEPDKELSVDGLPDGYSIETIRHAPGNSVSEYVSYTGVRAGVRMNDDDPIHRLIRITGFGHSFDVPGLEWDGGWEVGTGEPTMVIRFQDVPKNPTKRLLVTLSLKRLPLSRAKELAGIRRITLPDLNDTGWSLTLPPIPEKVEKYGADQPAAAPESKPECKDKTKSESKVRPQ